jgi:hypothetical protein
MGWISESFPVHCGIRQGCPFSPLAFIIALEMLAIKIREDQLVKGIKLPISPFSVQPTPLLKILLYADDITLFLQDTDDLNRILQLLKEFSFFSALEVNKNKTEAMWIGSTRHSKDQPCGISWKQKIKILGIFFSNSISASQIEDNWTQRIKKNSSNCYALVKKKFKYQWKTLYY